VSADVRRLTERELPRLQAALPSWNRHEYARRVGFQARGLAVQLVAWRGDAAVGRAMLVLPGHPEWSPSAFREGCPEIRDLAVSHDVQRQGVGSALLGALEREAATAGFATIGLAVGIDDAYEAARGLYDRHGYRFAHGPFIAAAQLEMDDGSGVAVASVCEFRVKRLPG
jgi:GNAT superfamily N-acetyltransferase